MMPRADDGQTPLDLAMRYNRQDCIPLLSMESPAHIHIVWFYSYNVVKLFFLKKRKHFEIDKGETTCKIIIEIHFMYFFIV